MDQRIHIYLFLFLLIWIIGGCKKENSPPTNSAWQGSGVTNFADFEPQADKVVRLFYYVPVNVDANTPIVMVFHGAERNALEYRNALINKANEYQFIVVVPEFSEANFPDVNGYQIGFVYQNGDQPSPATLRPESLWSLSLVEPIFAFVKNKTKNTSATYQIISHSGGAQFAHRLLFFKPLAKFDKAVISAAGWYTATDKSIDFPYGMQGSPLENLNFAPVLSKDIIIQVGSSDNNPNSATLRHTPQADAQGLHRLARAQYFYQKAENLADSLGLAFTWRLSVIPGLGHQFVDALPYSADLLFQ